MQHRVTFRARESPLAPCGVTAQDEVVQRLLGRLRERADSELGRLDGVRAPGLLVLLGDREQLPWCDGAGYVGRDPQAPVLLLPVHLEPDVPLPWLAAALPGVGPRLLLPHAAGLRVVSLVNAGRVDRTRLFRA